MRRALLRTTRLLIPLVLAISVLAPPAGPAAAEAGAVRAVVVKSWSGCNSGGVIWDSLNTDWASYGSIPITIDYTNPALCNGPVTYAALSASGADVVIISDAAGGNEQFLGSEVRALRQYAGEGHDLIGTFLTFQWETADNRLLAPLFGLRSLIDYGGGDAMITPAFDLVNPGLPLFRDVPDPFVSEGYPFTQSPADGVWDENERRGARYVATTGGSEAVITLFRQPAFFSIYLSTMPELGGGTADRQLFYNAIIFPLDGS